MVTIHPLEETRAEESPTGTGACPDTNADASSDAKVSVEHSREVRVRESGDEEHDARWVTELQTIQGAKPLVDHLAALEKIISAGGEACVEPATEQVSTWRRALLFDAGLSSTRPIFGVRVPDDKDGTRMPRVIAMCSLSGVMSAFYSDHFSLARILCMSAQPTTGRVIDGMKQLCSRAAKLDATVLVCMCLPFHARLSACYWEARLVRRLANGELIDGALAFAKGCLLYTSPSPRD